MKWVALAALFTFLNAVRQEVVDASEHDAVAKVPIAVFFTAPEPDLPAPQNVTVDALSSTELRVSWYYPRLPELNLTEDCPVISSVYSTFITTTDTRGSARIVVDKDGTEMITEASPTTTETSTKAEDTSTSEVPHVPHLEFEVEWMGPDGNLNSDRTFECQYVVTGLTPATNYTFAVRALYEGFESELSEAVEAQTMTSPTSNLPLILGLSIGIPLVLIIAVCLVYLLCCKKERETEPKLRPTIELVRTEDLLREEFQSKFDNREPTRPTDIAKKFRNKNCYDDVLPYDHTLVRLSNVDYINASFVLGKKFIAAQDPMPDQGDDFWQLIWEHNVHVIVRLSSDSINQPIAIYVQEAGVGHWVMGHDELEVTVTTQSSVGSLLSKTLQVSKGQTQRTIHFYHLKGWFDDALPTPEDLVRLVMIGRSSRRELGPRTPVLVHCGAGAGRTGTLIAVWQMIDLQVNGKMGNLVRVLEDMRKDRVSMIQSKEQYILAYQSVKEYESGDWSDGEENYEPA
ncbi:receptor-type tyrosine-protein phosphatase H-like isoform X2 [Penaeus chinensis]|uniref:receptor-type tyrosine-protein phosphatase H-like isoform X2 n=1 Tax=Penaeus chinensis TaxID=139456 RepID=UPI001FB7CA43|nr:receptor-type tyrosine-protein phosphatase H-like isoform X2 [Penaeus chinensis]